MDNLQVALLSSPISRQCPLIDKLQHIIQDIAFLGVMFQAVLYPLLHLFVLNNLAGPNFNGAVLRLVGLMTVLIPSYIPWMLPVSNDNCMLSHIVWASSHLYNVWLSSVNCFWLSSKLTVLPEDWMAFQQKPSNVQRSSGLTTWQVYSVNAERKLWVTTTSSPCIRIKETVTEKIPCWALSGRSLLCHHPQ